MRRSFTAGCGAALALTLLAAAGARADAIPYTYQWQAGQLAVAATGAGTGGVSFTNEVPQNVIGSTGGAASDLRTFSSTSFSNPDMLSSTPWSLSLTIKDGGQTGTPLTWSGALSGSFSLQASNITNTFSSPMTQTTTVNGDTYTVTLGPYIAPGVPSDPNAGSIGFQIDVKGGSSDNNGGGGGTTNTGHSPEPSTALLSCLGISFAGLASWRKWRQQRKA